MKFFKNKRDISMKSTANNRRVRAHVQTGLYVGLLHLSLQTRDACSKHRGISRSYLQASKASLCYVIIYLSLFGLLVAGFAFC